MDLDQLRALTGQLLQLGGDRISAALTPVRVRRRKPRRTDPVTFVVRVDLVGAVPPVWRRVELPSTLMLDELHDLLQLLFDWTDSHLHRFALGASVWDREAELFLCPYDVEAGEQDGTPTCEVRLDETLADVGDRLRYVYDYGDDWMVLLKVEKVLPGAPGRPRVTGGRRGVPGEDIGGAWAWNQQPEDEPFDVAELDELVADWAS